MIKRAPIGVFVGVNLWALCALAVAQSDASDDSTRYKLSIGAYRTTDSVDSLDLNLRRNQGPHTAWIGYYADSRADRQTRAGYEYNISESWVRATASLQIASGGFLGGSLTGELGPAATYAVLGFGRTDLHDYVNLNFDPNDMIMFGAGYKPSEVNWLSVYRIQDDRLPTRQKVTHVVYRHTLGKDRLFIADLFYKSGLIDDGTNVTERNAIGAAFTYDFEQYFLRFAIDPYVNFSNSRMVRMTIGRRF